MCLKVDSSFVVHSEELGREENQDLKSFVDKLAGVKKIIDDKGKVAGEHCRDSIMTSNIQGNPGAQVASLGACSICLQKNILNPTCSPAGLIGSWRLAMTCTRDLYKH